ncbi:hypothetical protein D9756_009269 [Leucocoprinus leucothites]|uniref:Nephrocystin 3-like N-terminal domain-containing protein n=1 Tax=Leucocoprinus leucothites TaxID=201217 RepID=A0A8H5D0X2_9AGAR|nr:hypothetical protein D9756_009269 [Leucoagaricus leucothites]
MLRHNRKKPYDRRSRTDIKTQGTNESQSNSSSINAVQTCVTPHDLSSIPNGVPECNRISQAFVGQGQTTGSALGHSPMQLPFPTLALASRVHGSESLTSQAESRDRGFFANAHHINMYNPIMQDFSNQTQNPFMENFAKHIMPGAAYDSSARFPPPRCHAGTWLDTVKQARDFFQASKGKKRLLWIVGPAGVGKSAIMQTIAETSPNLGASFFFTVSIRDDPSKLFVTLAYQISVHRSAYRERLQAQLSFDPTLLEKAVTVQFEAFFVDPFGISTTHGKFDPLLILVDGLDECAGSNASAKFLNSFRDSLPAIRLRRFSGSSPADQSPISLCSLTVWLGQSHAISSSSATTLQRAETVSSAFFVIGCRRSGTNTPRTFWPPESQILLLLAAADGMFAYAEAVSCFIEDPNIADPVSQLEVVLDVINHTSAATIGNEDFPMAQLYALYDRILSRVPPRIFPITKQILIGAGVVGSFSGWQMFGPMCQLLGLTASKAYSALHHLHAVLIIPSPETAFQDSDGQVTACHKSFQDFLSSRFPDVTEESWGNLAFSCYLRILKDIPICGTTRETQSLTTRLSGELGENPHQHIVLYWSEVVSDEERDQARMYSGASSWLSASEFLKPRILSGDADTLHALHVMSIGPTPGSALTPDRSGSYSWFLDDDSLSPILRNRGLLQDWKISSLDLDHINTDYYLHVICTSSKWLYNPLRAIWLRNKCHEIEWDSHRRESHEPHEDNELQELEMIIPCKCKCIQPAWENLKYARVHAPETSVMVYVPAHRRGIVICDLPDREYEDATWRYIIPYIFPPDI